MLISLSKDYVISFEEKDERKRKNKYDIFDGNIENNKKDSLIESYYC